MLVEHFGAPDAIFQATDREFMEVEGLSNALSTGSGPRHPNLSIRR